MGRKKGMDRETWWLNKKGYIEGRVFRSGICRQVKQARWLMEQHIDRELTRQEIIHHINGIKTDNRLENLEIMEYGKHTTNHCKGKKKKSGYQMNLPEQERIRRSEFMKEVHRRRQESDPTNSWYGQRKANKL